MANISFNPALTTAPQNSFLVDTQGYYQGSLFDDDPAIRLSLFSGLLNSTVTQPVWGGMALTEVVNNANANALGNSLQLATAEGNVTAFSMYNQAYNSMLVPGNSAPIAVAGNTTPYFKLGSKAQIVVACSAALVTAVEGGFSNQQVSWDFTTQQLIPFATTALPVQIQRVSTNSRIVAYNSGTGAVTWTVGNAAVILI
jgi:hypothetical protein